MTPATNEQLRLELVPRSVVRPLQMAVLRPGRPIGSADLVDEPGAFYVGAFQQGPDPVGAASFLPEPYPRGGWLPPQSWRLRGMATEPALQGRGIGLATLRFGLQEVMSRSGTFVWCNARTVALRFYDRLGFVAVGEEFLTGIGIPHYLMHCELGPASDQQSTVQPVSPT